MTHRTSIGGALDMAALARLHFVTLSEGQQRAAVRRLAAAGNSEQMIAAATGWSVEGVRRVLSERERP